MTDIGADVSLFEMIVYEKQLIGCLFGHANPRADIPKLLSLYRDGSLMLDELVTRTYTLDQITTATRTCGRTGTSAAWSCTTSRRWPAARAG